MKLTQLFLCSASLALPLTLNAATQKSDDRWFDVEIILFSQLDDKSQSKESFPELSELPTHRRVEDLLLQYLNPDIRSLKQLLPHCDAIQNHNNLVQKQAKLPEIFEIKSLAQLEELVAESMAINDTSQTLGASESELNNALVSTKQSVSETIVVPEQITEPNNNTKYSTTDSNAALLNADSNLNAAQGSSLGEHDIEPSQALTAAERENIQALLLAAENAFQAPKFEYSMIVEPNILCKMDESTFTDYQANNPSFDYYGFSVDKVPLLIDGKEEVSNNHTHLLSKESLQLGDIIKDLRYSKNFRPMLHMGWRQVARPEKESIPVKVYAGDNFFADHTKQLARYNQQKNLYIAEAKDADNEQSIMSIETMHEQADNNQNAQLQAAKALRIQEIITQLPKVNDNTEALLTSLESQDLSLNFENQNPLITTPPKVPVQPWFIDGFFNIHLQHYLFITADFNILDKNLSEIATARLTDTSSITAPSVTKTAKPIQAKAIRFKQNRRVISGEVHYFDHPYMGMIVQIRPYTKPEPEDN